MKIFSLTHRPGDPVLIPARCIAIDGEPTPGTGALVVFFSSIQAAELWVAVVRFSPESVEDFMAKREYCFGITTAELAAAFLASRGEVALNA